MTQKNFNDKKRIYFDKNAKTFIVLLCTSMNKVYRVRTTYLLQLTSRNNR